MMLMATLLLLSSCANQSEEFEVAETLVFSGFPPITELIKSITTSKEEDEENKGTSNTDALETTGENYLVCMCYGTPDAAELKKSLRFVLVSGGEILYDDECVSLGEAKDYDIPNNPFHGAGKRNVEGIMVVPFELLSGKSGMLYVDYADYDDGKKVLLETPVGEEAGGIKVSVNDVKIGYLNAQTYNDGGFADEDMTESMIIVPGEPSYMVLDVSIAAQQKNEGDLSMSCHVGFPGLLDGGVTVEAAPTTDIKMSTRSGILDVCTTYSVPQEKNGEKNVRVVLRINEPEAVGEGIHLLLVGNESVKMVGTVYMPDLVAESRSFESFVPAWQMDTMPTWGKVLLTIAVVVVLFFVAAIIVASTDEDEWWGWFFPVMSWIATAVAMILMFCLAPFAWWVVLITTLAFYTVLTLSYVLAAKIVGDNVGNCGPLVVGFLLSAVGSIMIFVMASWIWWASLIAIVGVCAVPALICGAIGYNM